MLTVLVIAVLIGLLPAYIANRKGRNFFLWWFYGSAIFILAIIHSILLKDDGLRLSRELASGGGTKKCPHCAEFIKREAAICRYCRSEQPV